MGFPYPFRAAVGPTQPPIKWVLNLLPGDKRPGRGINHPPPSNIKVKERVELYPYFPLGHHGLCFGELDLLFIYLFYLFRCSFIYGLFHYCLSLSENIASNSVAINE
jgi:hypothetical protein